ncbi:MAG: glutamine-hydrolyzing carbamoyl-phosphate synthase small subunit [Magnetococcales bacterium]|nr:glutamine-hydrolyzing carbamoyl-phosphate synthase small subunit [Magnetococcales bacterium]
MTNNSGRAVLMLEDGSRFDGRSCGAVGEEVGEVCFNTSMTGYQEIMTDPSYAGQLVAMTYTQIGNTGINSEDMESERPWIRGFIIKESSRISSNWRSQESLNEFLTRNKIPAIEGIDTRQLVSLLRSKGSQRGVLSTVDFDSASLLSKTKAWPGLVGMNLTKDVTCAKSHMWQGGDIQWKENPWHIRSLDSAAISSKQKKPYSVVAVDFGVKHNILRNLTGAGCSVTVVPASISAEEILAMNPDGVFLSNGPGDPEAVTEGITTIKGLLNSGKPLFGICLGHQMLCLALGASTKKMKFGHRGGNHPVKNLKTGLVEVTSQNHGFMVDRETLPPRLEVTHESLFDGTVEGVRLKDEPVFSVQYHPEASPGPHDAHYLFSEFVAMMGRSGAASRQEEI